MKNLVFICCFISVCLLVSCVTAGNNSQNSAIENILNRKSVRQYSDKKVEQEKIDMILKCAMAAPSGMNKQPWEFLVVTDKGKLEKIAEIAKKEKCVEKAPQKPHRQANDKKQTQGKNG